MPVNKNFCPNPNSPEWQELVELAGSATVAYKIWNDAGRIIPTGDNLEAFLERENSQEAKVTNLGDRFRVEDIVNKLSNPEIEALPDSAGYINKTTGELVDKRVSMMVDELRRAQGRFFRGDGEFFAKKGTVIHEYMNYLTSNIAAGNDVNYTDANRFVQEGLRKSERFKNEESNFFKLYDSQFKLLKTAGEELITEINELQKSIDPEGEAQFFNEVVIYDDHRNMAGTVDLLVVFSDGSSSIYDFKTFSQKTPDRPYSTSISEWDIQLSNYRNMLKNNYGINRFRHTRVIPIRTSYSEKTADGWVHQIADGFQVLAAKTRENNLDYLDPIPFSEETGDTSLDSLLNNIRKKIKDLDVKIVAEYGDKKFGYKRQKERLTRALNDLSLNKDTSQLFNYLRSLARSTNNRLSKAKTDEDYINDAELVELISELKIFEDLALNLEEQVKGDKKYRQQAIEAQQYIRKLMEDINQEIVDRLPDDILQSGYVPGNRISRTLMGIGNFDMPVFREVRNLWRKADEMTRIQSLRDIRKIEKVDKNFSDWAKSNGYSQQGKFSILLDNQKNLHRKHTDEFYNKLEEFRKKAKEGLTTEDKRWLVDNFTFDMEAYKKHHENFMESIKRDLEETGNREEYERKLEIYNNFTNVYSNVSNKFRQHNFQFYRAKENNTNYINPAWEFIQNNKPVKEYYDMLQEYIREWTDILGRDMIGENFVPNVEQSVMENLLEHGKKNIREAVLKKFELRENDHFGGRMVDGKPVQSIPIIYLDRLRSTLSESKRSRIEDDVAAIFNRGTPEFKEEVAKRVRDKEYEIGLDSKSTDLTKSFMLFANSINEYVNFSEVEPTIRALKYIVETDQVEMPVRNRNGKIMLDKFTNAVVKKLGLDPEMKDIFDTLTNRLIYKQKFNEELLNMGRFSSNKVISSLMQWLAVRALGLNVVITASNFIQGKTGMYMAAKEGLYFDKDDLKEAYKAFANHEEGYLNAVEYLMPTTRDIVRERIELSGASFASRRLRSRSFFLGHIKGDDAVDNSLAVAMAKRWVVDSDGKIKNPLSKTANIINKDAPTVYDSIKYNEETGESYIAGMSFEELRNFRAKIQKQSYKIKGMMSEEHKGAYAGSMLWTMFMQFRTWSVGLAESRFSELKYDSTMEEYEIGRFNAALGGILKNGAVPAFKEAANLIAEVALMGLYKPNPNMDRIRYKYEQFISENPEHQGQFTIEQFMELQKAKMNGFLTEARIYTSIILLAQILAGMGWDEEEETNLFTWNSYQITRRAMLELSFWFNPGSVDEIVRSPLPLWGLFMEMQRLVDSSVREVSFAVQGERDPRVKTSPAYYALKSTPVVNQVLDFMKYFDQYNPPKTSIDYIFDMFGD